MTRIARQFGIAADATAGGTNYDTLVAGAIADSTESWPLRSGTLDKNQTRIDRSDEAGVDRFSRQPIMFRQAPVFSGLGGPLYFSLAKRLLPWILAVEGTRSGTPPAAVTHPLSPLPFGATLPIAKMVQLVRDELNQKGSGGIINRLALNFPMEGEATWEADIPVLYSKHDTAAIPAAVFTGQSAQPMMLRDVQVFLDGAGTSIPNLEGMTWEFNNNIVSKWGTMRNRVPVTAGSQTKIWFPDHHKLGARGSIRWGLTFGDADVAAEAKHDFATAQKIVMEAYGGPLGTTPAADELLRITNYAAVSEDGGPEGFSATDDISANYTGGAFYSTADAKALLVELVDTTNAALLP